MIELVSVGVELGLWQKDWYSSICIWCLLFIRRWTWVYLCNAILEKCWYSPPRCHRILYPPQGVLILDWPLQNPYAGPGTQETPLFYSLVTRNTQLCVMSECVIYQINYFDKQKYSLGGWEVASHLFQIRIIQQNLWYVLKTSLDLREIVKKKHEGVPKYFEQRFDKLRWECHTRRSKLS